MRRLEPAGDPPDPAAWLASLGLGGPGGGSEPGGAPGRPRVVAVMVSSLDGRAAVGGRSEPLSSPEDRALLRGLRAAADVVLAGPATLRNPGYGARMLDPEQVAAREAAGRPAFPTLVTISRSGQVPWDAPAFAAADVPKLVATRAVAAVPAAARGVELLDADAPGDVLAALEARGVGLVACEGGPTLLRALLEAGLVDDLLLTVAPLLVAGDEPRLLTGPAFRVPPALGLHAVAQAGDHLFLHHRLR